MEYYDRNMELAKIGNKLQNPLGIKEIDEGKVHCYECEGFEPCPCECGYGKCDVDKEWKNGDEWQFCSFFTLNSLS